MKLSITGTRRGLTEDQWEFVNQFIWSSKEYDTLIHGAAEGADSECHGMAIAHGLNVIIYPASDVPSNLERLNVIGCIVKPAEPALERNKLIVAGGDLLLGFPRTMDEEIRSGTWAAIRYARRLKSKLWIIWPNGDITKENE